MALDLDYIEKISKTNLQAAHLRGHLITGVANVQYNKHGCITLESKPGAAGPPAEAVVQAGCWWEAQLPCLVQVSLACYVFQHIIMMNNILSSNSVVVLPNS